LYIIIKGKFIEIPETNILFLIRYKPNTERKRKENNRLLLTQQKEDVRREKETIKHNLTELNRDIFSVDLLFVRENQLTLIVTVNKALSICLCVLVFIVVNIIVCLTSGFV